MAGLNNKYSLSADEKRQFDEQGWIGPFPLLSAGEAAALAPELDRAHGLTRGMFYPEQIEPGKSYYRDMPWFQSLHALSPLVAEIGMRPEIVNRVVSLLGEDLLLWGGIRFSQPPGCGYHWHTDTEFDHVDGVSIWLGVQNVSPANSLKVMSASDAFKETPEDYLASGRYAMDDLASDALVESLARKAGNDASVVRPPVNVGEFFIFKGKLWHGSDNFTSHTRYAMGLRYSPPSQAVRTPLTYLHPLQWDPEPPPCLLVSGKDQFGLNRIVEPPT